MIYVILASSAIFSPCLVAKASATSGGSSVRSMGSTESTRIREKKLEFTGEKTTYTKKAPKNDTNIADLAQRCSMLSA